MGKADVPRWDREGGRIATTLFEVAAFRYSLRVTCRCDRVEVLSAHALWWRFHRKGWDDRLVAVPARLRCARCGKQSASVVTTAAEVTVTALPLPPVHEWKRAVNRFRN